VIGNYIGWRARLTSRLRRVGECRKLGIDSHVGWFGYMMRNDLCWVKKFKTYPDRACVPTRAVSFCAFKPAESAE
jgi:hypothetical protein